MYTREDSFFDLVGFCLGSTSSSLSIELLSEVKNSKLLERGLRDTLGSQFSSI